MERMAGELLGVDLREGLNDPGGLRELQRVMRPERLMPRSVMAPERSEPGFSLSGAYQPEVAYGA